MDAKEEENGYSIYFLSGPWERRRLRTYLLEYFFLMMRAEQQKKPLKFSQFVSDNTNQTRRSFYSRNLPSHSGDCFSPLNIVMPKNFFVIKGIVVEGGGVRTPWDREETNKRLQYPLGSNLPSECHTTSPRLTSTSHKGKKVNLSFFPKHFFFESLCL